MSNLITIKNLTIGIGKPKICVPIVGKNEIEIIEQINQIKDSKAELVEWRVDFFGDVRNHEKLMHMLSQIGKELNHLPILFTFRTKREGGNCEMSPEEYEELLTKVILSELVDIIDIEFFLDSTMVNRLIDTAHKNDVRILLSNHDFHKTPSQSEIVSRLVKMQEMNADIVKIAVMPKSKKDVLTLLAASEEMAHNHANRPVVTIAMAQDGILSRIAGEFIGSSITFASVGNASAPGQITVDELSVILEILHKNCKKTNLFFIGFMGTGKTTISHELSELTGMKEVDMDSCIVQQEKVSISQIFEQYGEEYFRKIETKMLIELLSENNQIISCGGGIVLKEENIEIMKQNGTIVLLTAKPDTILERVKNDESRPILKGNMNLDYIQNLLEKRKDYYLNAADIIIETDKKSSSEICSELLANLE